MTAYRNFICYRGSESSGKQIASQLFDVLDKMRDIVGLTYFSPEGIQGGAERNYLADIELLREVKNVILILTPDYLDDFLTDEAEPNFNSVAVKEFDTILDGMQQGLLRGIVPVFCGGFSWRKDNLRTGIPNKDTIEYIWGEEGVQVFTAATGNGRSHDAASRMPDEWGTIPHTVLDYVIDSIRVGFPLTYIRQAGHIVYLPTLLELTPFEYTYLVLSDRGVGCASELNYARNAGDHVWSEFSWREYISSASFCLAESTAIVVNVPEEEAGCIPEVLRHRNYLMPSIPLLVNVFGRDCTVARRDVVAKSVPEITCVPGTLLVQDNQAEAVPQLTEREIRLLYDASPTECWRRLFGNSGYGKLARTLLGERRLRDLYLLATEQTRENFACWQLEKLKMLGDIVMREQTDTNEVFLARSYDWERA